MGRSVYRDPYEAALARLLEVPSSPRLGLERMATLLAGLDDPHRAFRSLHVAGTNGKGSVCAYLDAMLGAASVRRGLTTSPHLASACERIQIEGRPISRARFVELEERVARAAARLDEAPTFFERMIAMAFLAFAEEHVDVAVVEVGLGGSLDATNVLSPLASGIARVGLDHQMFLGDSLASIAREKAGILKPGVPAGSAPQEQAAADVLRAIADEVGVPLRFVSDEDVLALQSMELGLPGPHQRENAALALAILDAARLVRDPDRRREGLALARWPGRYERVGDLRPILLDGAHNPLGARTLAQALRADPLVGARPIALVVGMTRGHEGADFARELAPLLNVQRVFAVRARAPRSRPADEVAKDLEAGGLVPVEVRGVEAALLEAQRWAEAEGGAVVVTGSLYLVGEVRSAFVEMDPDPALPDF